MRYAERCAEQRHRLDCAAAEVVAVWRDCPASKRSTLSVPATSFGRTILAQARQPNKLL